MHPTSPHLGSRYHQKHLTHLVNCICKPFVCLLIFVSYEMLLDVISDWLCGAPLSHLYVAYQPASVEHRVRSNHTKVNCETGKINFMKRQKNIVIKLTKTFQKCTNNCWGISGTFVTGRAESINAWFSLWWCAMLSSCWTYRNLFQLIDFCLSHSLKDTVVSYMERKNLDFPSEVEELFPEEILLSQCIDMWKYSVGLRKERNQS